MYLYGWHFQHFQDFRKIIFYLISFACVIYYWISTTYVHRCWFCLKNFLKFIKKTGRSFVSNREIKVINYRFFGLKVLMRDFPLLFLHWFLFHFLEKSSLVSLMKFYWITWALEMNFLNLVLQYCDWGSLELVSSKEFRQNIPKLQYSLHYDNHPPNSDCTKIIFNLIFFNQLYVHRTLIVHDLITWATYKISQNP